MSNLDRVSELTRSGGTAALTTAPVHEVFGAGTNFGALFDAQGRSGAGVEGSDRVPEESVVGADEGETLL